MVSIADDSFFGIDQEFDQIDISSQMLPYQPGNICERPFILFLPICFIFYDFDQKISDQGTPKLYSDGILVISEKIAELEVLLNTPEKYFNLPSSFIDAGYG